MRAPLPSSALPLALTIGEPAGIGADITLAAWLQRTEKSVPPFYLLTDPDHLAARAQHLGLTIPITIVTPDQAAAKFASALPVVPLDHKATAQPGAPDDSSAPVAIASIRQAVTDVVAGHASAVVTNPISKAVLYRHGFRDPGHTEYLARLAKEMMGVEAMPVMMLWCEDLAVVPITVHVALHAVPGLLSSDLIVKTGEIVAHALTERFGIARPRIAITGLNPHAGEDGALGDEDITIIRPAIEQLKSLGIDAGGPLPADTLFHAAARRNYDVALCMYHDQALIPIKTIAFDDGVNVTLGLPFVRTSPDHGTAFDIAGSGKANPASLIAALRLAAHMADATKSAAPAA